MSKQTFFLVHDQARKLAQEAIRLAPDGYCVEIKQSTRTLEQNSRLWALLTDISRQVDWHGRRLHPEEWKSVFTAALKKQDVVPNIDGTGFVVLGLSTSKMTKSEMIDLQTLIEAFGANHGVRFTDGY
jgi:hypothetical protein